MSVNKIIHEAMGLCNCVNHRFGDYTLELCPKCSSHHTSIGEYPDYTEPVHYCELMDWLKEEERWWSLDNWMFASNLGSDCICYILEKPRFDQLSLIALAVTEGALKK